jgi:hypothetical protein
MKTINHAINGLASSLLLNVGLTSVAEKFDMMVLGNSESVVTTQGAAPCDYCDFPCQFSPETGQ